MEGGQRFQQLDIQRQKVSLQLTLYLIQKLTQSGSWIKCKMKKFKTLERRIIENVQDRGPREALDLTLKAQPTKGSIRLDQSKNLWFIDRLS